MILAGMRARLIKRSASVGIGTLHRFFAVRHHQKKRGPGSSNAEPGPFLRKDCKGSVFRQWTKGYQQDQGLAP